MDWEVENGIETRAARWLTAAGLGNLSWHCGYGGISVALCFSGDVEFGLSESWMEVLGGENFISAVRLIRLQEGETNGSSD